jgi:Cu(I)/Ag(I) efflux system membrane protein CusA/SilA
MIARLVAWSAARPRVVVAAAVIAALAGEVGRRRVARDMLPDLSEPQVVLVADWMGHPAAEVASRVTGLLAGALEGVPGATAIRGSSMAGMGYVDVVFGDAGALGAGRTEIVRRVEAARARLPEDVRVTVGPEASSTGWVYQYVLSDPSHGHPPRELRRLQEEVLRPALAAVPGVAEIGTVSGATQEVFVEVDLDRLRERGHAFDEVVAAVRAGLPGATGDPRARLGALPLSGASAPAVGDVARVRVSDGMPTALADVRGVSAVVGGIVVARRDADLPRVVAGVRAALAKVVDGAGLPRGVRVATVYDRLELIDRVSATLGRALVEEIVVVALVVLAFLLHARSALIPLVTLPLVLLITFAALWILRVPATLMSLGGIGIALGVAVDAELVALEACHRRLETWDGSGGPDGRRAALAGAAQAFVPPILASLLITMLAFLPVLAFTGETGRLLRPLALTKTLVVAAAALVTVTLAPALRGRWLTGPVRAELANPLTRGLVRAYRPFVELALRRPTLTLLTAALAVLSCLPLLPRLGGEFLPRVDEGDLLFMPTALPGIGPEQVKRDLQRQDQALGRFGEVAMVFGKAGRADTATDRAPLSMIETTVRLLPRESWPARARARWWSEWAPGPLRPALRLFWPDEGPATTAELVEEMDRATRLPGWSGAWTAPVRARMDMMSTGLRAPLGLRVVASSPERLDALGVAAREVVAALPGTRGAVFEGLGGEPRLELRLDEAALARHQVEPAAARAVAELVLAGGQVGDLPRGGELLRVRVVPEVKRFGPADELRAVTVRSRAGVPVPLALLGRPTFVEAPAALRTERGEPCAYVHVDLAEGVDLAGHVADVRAALDAARLAVRPGERVELAGQYELLERGQRRLALIVPVVVLAMLALLIALFRSLTEAAIVLAAVPFALVGSVWTLFLLGYPMSAPVWVGLLSVVGLAMQTGVVMVVYIDAAFFRRLREGGIASRDDIVAAHAEGTVRRLRPKVMTIATMAAGLLPLVTAQGAGSEVLRRVAAPMLGGLVTSAVLTLEVLPVLYTLWRTRQLRRAAALGVPLKDVVGTPPPWAR